MAVGLEMAHALSNVRAFRESRRRLPRLRFISAKWEACRVCLFREVFAEPATESAGQPLIWPRDGLNVVSSVKAFRIRAATKSVVSIDKRLEFRNSLFGHLFFFG
jgi:hypothetical protein